MNSFEKDNTAPSRSQDLAMRAGAQHITGTEGPLSMSQEQAWFLETLVPESIAYNFQAMLNIRGNLDIKVLERALSRVVERHQSLSTVFDEVDGEPRQTIQDAWSVNIPIVDLSASSEAVRQTYMNSIVKAEIAQKIEVAKLPLIRWVLFKFSDQFHVLLHIEHHLIHDGWSFRLFLKELNHFYNEEKGRVNQEPLEPVIQFIDYCQWERDWLDSAEGRQGRDFWYGRLETWPAYTHSPFPAEKDAQAALDFVGSSVSVPLPGKLISALQAYGSENKSTLFETMFSLFACVVAARSGQTQQLIGTAVANRDLPGIENTIGMLVNMLPLRIDIDANTSWAPLLAAVKEEIRTACLQSHVPFSTMVADLSPDRVTQQLPYIQVAFSFHNSMSRTLDFADIDVEVVEGLANGSAKFDLNVICVFDDEVNPAAGGRFMLEYSTAVAKEADVRALMADFLHLAGAWLEQPAESLANVRKAAVLAAPSGSSSVNPGVEFWKQSLDLEASGLLPDHALNRAVSGPLARHEIPLSDESLARLFQACEQRNIEPEAALFSLYAVTMARYGGHQTVVACLGTAADGQRLATPLPLKLTLAAHDTFADVFLRAQQHCEQARHWHASSAQGLEQALDDSVAASGRAPQSLIQSVFCDGISACAEQGGESGSLHPPIEFVLDRSSTKASLSLAYAADLFAQETATSMAGHYVHLLEKASESLDQTLAQSLSAQHQAAIQTQCEGLDSSYPETSLHAIVEAFAATQPEAIAVRCGDAVLTYAQLNESADKVADTLLRKGVQPGDVVGICMMRSELLVAALLGVLKAGACYLSIDCALPAERRNWLLEEADVKWALIDESAPALRDATSTLLIGQLVNEQDDPRVSPLDKPVISADAHCYYMFTSGSTGTPKATASTHRAVVSLVKGTDYIDIKSDDRFLFFAPLAFDASTFEIWGALLNGAQLVVQPGEAGGLDDLAHTLENQQVSVLWLTSALFQEMVDQYPQAMAGVRHVLTGGDVVSPQSMRSLLARSTGTLTICYGPTEGTVFTTAYSMDKVEQVTDKPLIGWPIAQADAYIVDIFGQLAEPGVPGELFIGGTGITGAYLKRPELSRERFVTLERFPGKTLFRTGDLARWTPSRGIEFLGRSDSQIKIRGLRIEPGEVEQAIRQLPGVTACSLILRTLNLDKQLVAFVSLDGSVALDEQQIRVALRECLPDYMVPAEVHVIEQLPVNASGKVDKRALLELATQNGRARVTSERPSTALEKSIAEVWAHILNVPDVGRNEDFFSIGGHSLAGMRIMSRLSKQFGTRLSLNLLFEYPSVETLAGAIERAAEPLTA